MLDQTINSQQKDPKGCTLSPQLVFKVAYKLERKTKLLEGPGNLIKTFRPFGLRQLKIFFKNRVQVKNLRVKFTLSFVFLSSLYATLYIYIKLKESEDGQLLEAKK